MHQPWPNEDQALVCSACGWRARADVSLVSDQGLSECAVCSGHDLFVRKGFPQRLGVLIVVGGFLASCVSWYYYEVLITFAILLGTAVVDALLYVWMGNVLECYRCHAQYRDLPGLGGHRAFQLEVHERYRQLQARQRQAAGAQRAGSESVHHNLPSV